MTAVTTSERVRASVFLSPGQPLVLQRFPRPRLSQGEVLVRVDCCTLCGSDLHTYLGRRHGPAPSILGHEALGQIVELGPGRPPRDSGGCDLTIGDRVSWSVMASCGDCFFCRHELPQKCQRLFKYGHETSTGAHPLSGGLAEYCHLARGTTIVGVPPELPDTVAASANCATATVAAAHRAADGCHGKTVLIQGAGLLGLSAAAMASTDGAEQVIVADIENNRLETARRFGATIVVNVAENPHSLAVTVRQATDGRGVDVALEMSGAPDAMRQGIESLRTGGRYVLVGAVRPIGSVPLDVEQVVRRMWTIQGIHNYAPVDLVTAIDFLATTHRRFPFGELIAAEFPLDKADDAFQAMHQTKAIRIAVRPQ